MRSWMLATLCGLAFVPGSAVGFEAQAVLRKVDPEQRTIVVFGGGRQRTVKVAADAKILDEKGAALADGLKSAELKEGANITLTVEPAGNEPVIRGIQLGEKAGAHEPGDNSRPKGPNQDGPPRMAKPSVGLKPLTEMTASDNYKGEDGGLYGGGSNEPPPAQREAAASETAKIAPLDAAGQPSAGGTIGLVSISMSNATMEFSTFKRAADADREKSPLVTIVDCAQGGQAMAQWTSPNAPPWSVAEQRLQSAGVSPKQVQVAWIKLANVRPSGELADHGKKLQADTLAVLQNAKSRFPNLRIAYLGSRIYAGYASTPLNPEPYAYEGAFVVRWLIQDQIQGNAELNWNPDRGPVKVPLLLWGPYLWADGTTARKSDGLIYERQDLGGDGTHPSDQGRQKVADQLLTFFKTDAEARRWFRRK